MSADEKDEKKDLTNILEYSETLKKLGQTDPTPEKGVIVEETPIEKIDEFETLEQYASSNPMPEPQVEAPSLSNSMESAIPETSESDPTPPSDSNSSFNSDFPASSENSNLEGSNSPLDLSAPLDSSSTGGFSETPSDLPNFNLESVNQSTGNENYLSEQKNSEKNDPSSPIIADTPLSFSSQGVETPLAEESIPQQPNSPPLHPLDAVKKFTEEVIVPINAVPAAFPFSLLITGGLSAEEKEKLLNLVSKENMGIRELDLEPQLENDRILIPRISEYAGVLLVQALRGTQAQMKLGPSESIFIPHEMQGEAQNHHSGSLAHENKITHDTDISHPAEDLPLTT